MHFFPDILTVSAEILASLAAERVKREKEGGINRSEIVNLDAVDGFEGNCYYIGKNPLYATGDYRQRMEGVFVKAKQL